MTRNKRAQDSTPEPDELTRLALDLSLTTLAAHLPELLRQAEKHGLSYTDFALSMFRKETDARAERRIQRRLHYAHLGVVEGVEGFDFSMRPQLEPRVIKELLNCRFVQEHRNIICIGRPGLGKTRIAKAIAQAACLQGHSTLFTATADMLDDLHGSLADGTYKRVFRRYAKPALIVLDEFGYQPFETKAANYLFRLVSARHGQGAIVLTANTGFTKWASFFPSEAQAVATVDRLLDRATILRFTGKTCRTPKDIHGAPLDD